MKKLLLTLFALTVTCGAYASVEVQGGGVYTVDKVGAPIKARRPTAILPSDGGPKQTYAPKMKF